MRKISPVMKHWLQLTLLPPIGEGLIRLLGRTVRIRHEGTEAIDRLYREERHCIFAFWHGRQLMMPLAYRGKGAHVLISQHRDGELIARIVARFGFQSVRGSTTRGGVQALRELIRLGRSGVDLVVTPDGPKGPRQVANVGVVQLACATELPIVPITFSCSKKKSSRAGIASSFRIRRGGGCLCGGSRSGSQAEPRRRMWRRSVWNWR